MKDFFRNILFFIIRYPINYILNITDKIPSLKSLFINKSPIPNLGRKIELVILFLKYDDKYKESFSKAKRCIDKIINCEKKYIIINNKDEKAEAINIFENIYVTGGSNIDREFSGWQRGLKLLASLEINYDIILFLNDSCFVHGPNIIEKNNLRNLLTACIKTNSILGQIDSIDSKLNIYDYEITSWVRTNSFFIPKNIVSKIGNIVSITNTEMDNFISPKYQGETNLFQKDAPIDNACKYYIVNHLTRIWHSKFKIDDSSWKIYRKKTGALLNEFLFTAKCREKGINIINHEDL